MKEIMDMEKKMWGGVGWGAVGEGFQDIDLGKLQKLLDTRLEELTEDDLMEASASEPVPDEEENVAEALPEN